VRDIHVNVGRLAADACATLRTSTSTGTRSFRCSSADLFFPVAGAAVEAMSFPAALAVEPRSATLLAGDRARTSAVEI